MKVVFSFERTKRENYISLSDYWFCRICDELLSYELYSFWSLSYLICVLKENIISNVAENSFKSLLHTFILLFVYSNFRPYLFPKISPNRQTQERFLDIFLHQTEEFSPVFFKCMSIRVTWHTPEEASRAKRSKSCDTAVVVP